ncbi:MAG: 4-hydroxythreonine-4-phosphate dehydrogenase PdxA [Proteobacteria bacterium]|nr:4-hydroxythreonine-4-phosphate dehydrogenase PdxA [Pseudomonadota bacterium]
MLAITPGEPAGIGPDCVVNLAASDRTQPWVVIADADLLRERADLLKQHLVIDEQVEQPSCSAGHLSVAHVPLTASAVPGQLDPGNASYVLATLDAAIEGCLSGKYQAMVTGPVQKSILSKPDRPFTGHTEYLRDRSGVSDVTMLLVADQLRVALATTHLPLRQVPDALSQIGLKTQLDILLDGLANRFGISSPRILVTGLNPHAGEDGQLGREEIEVITPVCDALRRAGHRVVGPLPADTAFTPRHLDQTDAVLAMYHDQGLPVLKFAGFGNAVNVTLGLPFIRTSVDHGTALDIAGSGHADSGSMLAAINLATSLFERPG